MKGWIPPWARAKDDGGFHDWLKARAWVYRELGGAVL
jgi:hypothetical protein